MERRAGFSLGRYCSGESYTDPWVLLTQGIVFYFIYCSWQRHCLGNHGASPLLAGAFCVTGVGHGRAGLALLGSRLPETDRAAQRHLHIREMLLRVPPVLLCLFTQKKSAASPCYPRAGPSAHGWVGHLGRSLLFSRRFGHDI